MSDKLLKATADAFEQMSSIDNLIQEHSMSMDESHAWCTQMAAIVTAYLRAPKPIQTTILAAGVAPTDTLGSFIWGQGILDFSTRKVQKTLSDLDTSKF